MSVCTEHEVDCEACDSYEGTEHVCKQCLRLFTSDQWWPQKATVALRKSQKTLENVLTSGVMDRQLVTDINETLAVIDLCLGE